MLLDLMLPGVDGIDLMKEIVSAGDVPVIADDYVVKPFSPTELVARIRAALRRRTTSEPSIPYVVGDLTIDYVERLVTLHLHQASCRLQHAEGGHAFKWTCRRSLVCAFPSQDIDLGPKT